MNQRIYSRAEALIRRYGTRDPFELLDAMHVNVLFSQAYSEKGLKGYCTILNRIKYVVINAKLPPDELAIVGSHECGHLALHSDELRIGTLSDFDIYNARGKMEREANIFAADYRISDEEAADLISGHESDFFSVASALRVPAPFFAFKLYSMVERGFVLRLPVEPDSAFMRTEHVK
jgi:Zn-dependent peptidase ImmA (M78 family)